jgi:hypothetical protein
MIEHLQRLEPAPAESTGNGLLSGRRKSLRCGVAWLHLQSQPSGDSACGEGAE